MQNARTTREYLNLWIRMEFCDKWNKFVQDLLKCGFVDADDDGLITANEQENQQCGEIGNEEADTIYCFLWT
jgi:hypothetical protein